MIQNDAFSVALKGGGEAALHASPQVIKRLTYCYQVLQQALLLNERMVGNATLLVILAVSLR